MWKKYKRKLSSLLIVVMIASILVPHLDAIADTADVIIGSNGTVYDADYEPYIYDEDEWEDDEDEEDYDNYENDVTILASGSNATPSNASPSNASLASDSNWSLASDSNAALNIVEFTEPGPFLPATGGFSLWSRLRSVSALADTDESTDDVSGIHTSKTATANDDGSYTIRLESYVEGNITKTSVTTPVDIVLVLDVSGSMDDCIVCGNSNTTSHTITSEYSLVGAASGVTGGNNTVYYYKNDSGEYVRAYYCSRSHGGNGGKPGQGSNQSHSAGWYTSNRTSDHNTSTRLSDDTEIYTATTKTESCESRMTALKSAVKKFVESVEKNAINNNVSHNIAVVKFAADMRDSVDAATGEIVGDVVIGNDRYWDYDYNNYQPNYSQIVRGLTDVSVNGNADSIINSVNSLVSSGATRADYGMKYAQYIINSIERESQKVVVMFTDGSPTSYQDFEQDVANAAISASYNIKNAGATVYTIGVFDGADAMDLTSNENKYMHYVSSNFKNAKGMSNPGTATYPDDGSSYYMSAGSSESLSDIFDNISSQIQSGGASIELGTDTVINDVVTPYFELPSGTSAIKVYTAECTGTKDSYGNYVFDDELSDVTSNVNVSVEKKTNAVSVTGFDYSKNFVASTGRVYGDTSTSGNFYGRKLIIEFIITPKDGFLGGNDVPTNESATISSSTSNVSKTFEDEPIVNVPVPDFSITAEDKHVYMTNTLAIDDLKAGAKIVRTSNKAVITLDMSKANYGLDDWQNAFVEINPTSDLINTDTGITDPLIKDGSYELSVTITPDTLTPTTTNGNDAVVTTKTAKGNIYVYSPVFTYKDGEVYYGDSIPEDAYMSGLRDTSVTWKHVAEDGTITWSTDEDIAMTGKAPTDFTFTYKPDSNKVNADKIIITKEDVPIRVDTVTISNTSVGRDKVFWDRVKCDENESDLEDYNFVLHVKTCNLTITKAFDYDKDASSDTFIFKINGNNAAVPVSSTVSIKGAGSVTLTGLPVGTYTITEDSDWSWRYQCSAKNNTPTLSFDNNSDEAIFKNTLTNDSWLNYISTALKNVFGVANQEVSDDE